MESKPRIYERRWFQAVLVVLLLWGIGTATAGGDDSTSDTSEQAATAAPTSSQDAGAATDPAQGVRAAVEQLLQGDTNNDQRRLREVSVESKPGGLVVYVYFNADDNLTVGLTRTGIEIDMGDIYRAIFTYPGATVKEANALAYLPLVDKFGNVTQELVYSTTLKGKMAAQVNWESDYLDFTQLWQLFLLHPALQN